MDTPYFPFYPGDWLSDPNVQFLTMEEAGAYITLLAYMWRDEELTVGPCLPDDDAFLARLLHVSTRKWVKLRKILIDGEHNVLEKTSDGMITNNRLYKEWAKVVDKTGKRSAAAKIRWSDKKQTDAHSIQMEITCNANASDVHKQNDAISDPDPDPESDPDLNKDDGNNVGRLFQAYQQIFVTGMNEVQKTDLLDYMDKGMEVDLMVLDFKKAARNNAGFSYAFRVIENQFQAGIKTIEQYEANEALRQAAASKPRAVPDKKLDEKDQRYSAFYELYPDE